MSLLIPITVCGFHDFPLNFLVRYQDRLYLFDRPFSDELDDYPEVYQVYRLPLSCESTPLEAWWQLPEVAVERFEPIRIADIAFDSTRKAAVDRSTLTMLIPTATSMRSTATNGKLKPLESVMAH